ncbi:MAG TPA: lysophospholipid acyltransferase family protein [Candidatus Deferrimicrobiaceae bacterium]|nr:lysophospholipid acyltransferase family protein [Candidatus Deferrimicrobiaceae bacterium]
MRGFYSVVRLVGRFWLWFFFKDVAVVGVDRVPAAGPVLLCINHPNNLIDSLLVGGVLPRKVHYLATAALFRNPVVARFLAACGAIPVYRRQDDPDKMDKNADAFAACFRALERGGLIGIYPEGTTHSESRVQRIKTGAARIALDYQAAGRGAPLTLIPVGLTFDARKAFRGHVRVSFGEPIALTPYAAVYRDEPAKAVEALTTAIQWGMEAEILHVVRRERQDLVRAVEELYRGDLIRELQEERGLRARQVDPLRLSRAIADAAAHFEQHDPERVERLWAGVQRYRALLAAYQMRDQAVRARAHRPPARGRLRRSWEASLGLPFFAYGLVVNGLPYLLPRWLARRTARKETDYATTRLLASVVAFPVFWALETWIVWRLLGLPWALGFALSLPVSGLIAYRYLGGVSRLQSQLRFGLLSLTHRQSATRLLAERQALVAELERAKDDYLAATRGSSF